MFKFDLFNNPKPYEMYLCLPNEEIICSLNGIDKQTASLTINLNNQYSLSFDYFKYISDDGKKIKSNGFDMLTYGMKIFVDRIGFFVVDYPTTDFDGSSTVKNINATSCDRELENKDLVNFKVNTGEKDSLEYLVQYDDDEQESLLNEYSGLPYDYIVFYNTFPQQLSAIHNVFSSNAVITDISEIATIDNICKIIPRLKSKVIKNGNSLSLVEYVIFEYDEYGNVVKITLNDFNNRISELITFYTKYRKQLSLLDLAIEKCNCNWSVGNIDSSLANKKFQFDEDGVNIYSFLTQNVATASNSVIWFDLFNKRINATLADGIGINSNVIIDRKNFVNSINISCDPSSICTRYNVSGGDDIGIEYVNFGTSRIDDISYFLNAKDSDGNLIYVTSSLAEKYKRFIKDREIARSYYMGNSKSYNRTLAEISDLKYKVPNDSVFNDWDTFSNEELNGELEVYRKLLITLISLYKNDYGQDAVNSDGSINEDFIKTTEYWLDYYAYNQTITQIEAAISQRTNGGTYNEIKNEQILKQINAYKTEWSLYGTIELQNKIEIYNNNLSVLADSEAVILRTDSDVAKTWVELSSDEKGQYGNLPQNYQYDVYNSILSERNSCQEYLNELNVKLSNLVSVSNIYQRERIELVRLTSLDGYNRKRLAEIVNIENPQLDASFTEEEIRLINLLYIDKNYSNENIVKTSLDTTITEVDVQYDLLNDAQESLSTESQPQITVSADVDNFLCMPEFKDYDFSIGNFVVLEYDKDYYVKLRVASIEFNPLIPTDDISITFTNYVKSRAKRTDISYILGNSSGGSSSASSSSSGGGNGSSTIGDGIDVTISNTMLSKLLNTEMFGSRVSDIILDTMQVNKINAKYAKFDGLAKGTTIIDGSCIQTGVIVSNNYNGTKTIKADGSVDFATNNTLGSIIKINDGTFNFGGGKLTFDGSSLNVNGNFIANSISAGEKTSANTQKNGFYVDVNGDIYSGSNNETKILSDGTFDFGGGKLTFDGSSLNVNGTINSDSGNIGGFTINEFGLENTYLATGETIKIASHVLQGKPEPLIWIRKEGENEGYPTSTAYITSDVVGVSSKNPSTDKFLYNVVSIKGGGITVAGTVSHTIQGSVSISPDSGDGSHLWQYAYSAIGRDYITEHGQRLENKYGRQYRPGETVTFKGVWMIGLITAGKSTCRFNFVVPNGLCTISNDMKEYWGGDAVTSITGSAFSGIIRQNGSYCLGDGNGNNGTVPISSVSIRDRQNVTVLLDTSSIADKIVANNDVCSVYVASMTFKFN